MDNIRAMLTEDELNELWYANVQIKRFNLITNCSENSCQLTGTIMQIEYSDGATYLGYYAEVKLRRGS